MQGSNNLHLIDVAVSGFRILVDVATCSLGITMDVLARTVTYGFPGKATYRKGRVRPLVTALVGKDLMRQWHKLFCFEK